MKKNEKKPELEDLENSQPTHTVTNEKACSAENASGVAGQPVCHGMGHVTRGSSKPSQQKYHQLERKGDRDRTK